MKIVIAASKAPLKIDKDTKLKIAPKQEAVKDLTKKLADTTKEVNTLALSVAKETDVKKRAAAIKKIGTLTRTLNSIGGQLQKRSQMVSNVIDKAHGTSSKPKTKKTKPVTKWPDIRTVKPGSAADKNVRFPAVIYQVNKKFGTEFKKVSGKPSTATLTGSKAKELLIKQIGSFLVKEHGFKETLSNTENGPKRFYVKGKSSIAIRSRIVRRATVLDLHFEKNFVAGV